MLTRECPPPPMAVLGRQIKIKSTDQMEELSQSVQAIVARLRSEADALAAKSPDGVLEKSSSMAKRLSQFATVEQVPQRYA